jgi:parallel beta helix pectate lyase-like protein
VGRKLVVAGITAALLASSPLPAFAAAANYYVDCNAASNGTGTSTSPWNSISAVNSRSGGFVAGDQILLKAGTTCAGSLAPKGSGSSGAPITLGAYGSGAKPIVSAAGQQTGLTLTNQSWWTVTGLEFTGATRRGVYVTVTTGVVSGITLRNLAVHDVGGSTLDSKNTGLVVVSPTHDSTNSTLARFNQVLIEGVVAHDTTMWAGIVVGTGTNADLWASTESKRSTNVTVRTSTVYNTYGDGIVLFAVGSGLLDQNVAHDVGRQSTQTIGTPNGIWTWACHNCTVQRNEVYRANSPGVDGGAFDIDYFSRNTVVQYNYGHDNSAYCVAVFGAEQYATNGAVIRYNVCAHNGTESGAVQEEVYLAVWNGGTINGVQIYGNTFVTAHGAFRAVNYNGSGSIYSGSLTRQFVNNIVYATTSNPLGGVDPTYPAPIPPSDYNVWYSTAGAWTNGEAHSVYANPQLVNPGRTGNGDPGTAYDLQSTSPAVDAGKTISGAGGRDFRGNSVPRGDAFDIGAVESPY